MWLIGFYFSSLGFLLPYSNLFCVHMTKENENAWIYVISIYVQCVMRQKASNFPSPLGYCWICLQLVEAYFIIRNQISWVFFPFSVISSFFLFSGLRVSCYFFVFMFFVNVRPEYGCVYIHMKIMFTIVMNKLYVFSYKWVYA